MKDQAQARIHDITRIEQRYHRIPYEVSSHQITNYPAPHPSRWPHQTHPKPHRPEDEQISTPASPAPPPDPDDHKGALSQQGGAEGEVGEGDRAEGSRKKAGAGRGRRRPGPRRSGPSPGCRRGGSRPPGRRGRRGRGGPGPGRRHIRLS